MFTTKWLNLIPYGLEARLDRNSESGDLFILRPIVSDKTHLKGVGYEFSGDVMDLERRGERYLEHPMILDWLNNSGFTKTEDGWYWVDSQKIGNNPGQVKILDFFNQGSTVENVSIYDIYLPSPAEPVTSQSFKNIEELNNVGLSQTNNENEAIPSNDSIGNVDSSQSEPSSGTNIDGGNPRNDDSDGQKDNPSRKGVGQTLQESSNQGEQRGSVDSTEENEYGQADDRGSDSDIDPEGVLPGTDGSRVEPTDNIVVNLDKLFEPIPGNSLAHSSANLFLRVTRSNLVEENALLAPVAKIDNVDFPVTISETGKDITVDVYNYINNQDPESQSIQEKGFDNVIRDYGKYLNGLAIHSYVLSMVYTQKSNQDDLNVSALRENIIDYVQKNAPLLEPRQAQASIFDFIDSVTNEPVKSTIEVAKPVRVEPLQVEDVDDDLDDEVDAIDDLEGSDAEVNQVDQSNNAEIESNVVPLVFDVDSQEIINPALDNNSQNILADIPSDMTAEDNPSTENSSDDESVENNDENVINERATSEPTAGNSSTDVEGENQVVEETEENKKSLQKYKATKRGGITFLSNEDIKTPTSLNEAIDIYTRSVRVLNGDVEVDGLTPEDYVKLANVINLGDDNRANIFEADNTLKENEFLTDHEKNAFATPRFFSHEVSQRVDLPQATLNAMWEIAGHSGLEEGSHIFDPSLGTGKTFSRAPEEFQKIINNPFAQLSGVETNTLYSAFLSQAHDKINVINKPLDEIEFQLENKPNFIIGNIPFNAAVNIDDKENGDVRKVHNFMMDRMSKLVKPGGTVIVSINRDFLDNPHGETYRAALSGNCRLVSAIRLPDSIYEKEGKDKSTDILVLRRYFPGEKIDINPNWIKTVDHEEAVINTPKDEASYNDNPAAYPTSHYTTNEYFQDNPLLVIGDMKAGSKTKRTKAVVIANDDNNVEENLKIWVEAIQDNLAKDNNSSFELKLDLSGDAYFSIPTFADAKRAKFGSVYKALNTKDQAEIFGTLVKASAPDDIISSFTFKALNLKGGSIKIMEDFIDLRDKYLEALDQQKNPNATDSQIETNIIALNALYDSFAEKHGILHSPKVIKVIQADTLYRFVQTLETLNTETDNFEKGQAFKRRIVTAKTSQPDLNSSVDALYYHFNNTGSVDVGEIAKLINKSPDEVIQELEGRIFVDPVQSKFVLAEEYLSGDVVTKLEAATKAAQDYPGFKSNVSALTEIQPERIHIEDIKFKLGAAFIPKHVFSNYFSDSLNIPTAAISLSKDVGNGRWSVNITDSYRNRASKEAGCDTSELNRLLGHALNNSEFIPPDGKSDDLTNKNDDFPNETFSERSAKLNASVNQIRNHFRGFVMSDGKLSNIIETQYNATQNRTVLAEFNGDFLSFDGMDPNITPYKTQLDAVFKYLVTGNIMAADEVGGGKTYILALSAMKQKEWGISKTTGISVLNPTTMNFYNQVLEVFPAANVKVLTPRSLSEDEAAQTMADLTFNDYDIVLIPHSVLASNLRLSPAALDSYIQKETKALRAEQSQLNIDGYVEAVSATNRIKTAERNLNKLRKEIPSAAYFDNMGIDSLFIDEAHYFYKGLPVITNNRDVRGLSTTSSIKSSAAHSIVSYITQDVQHSEKGIMLATGTPITNSVIEVYKIYRFLGESHLSNRGIHCVDDFLSIYTDLQTSYEMSASKTVKPFVAIKWVNTIELQNLYHTSINVNFIEDIPNIDRPDIIIDPITVQSDEMDEAFSWDIRKRAELIENGEVDRTVDNTLMLTTDGRRAAVDMRLIDPRLPKGRKLEALVDSVYDAYINGREKKTTQIVKLDIGVYKSNEDQKTIEDLYSLAREDLVERGMPRESIEFVQEIKGSGVAKYAKLEKLHERVRSGECSVLFGTIASFVGVNIQDRLEHMYIVDIPWRYDEMEQFYGRGQRTGNMLDTVYGRPIIKEDSFDSYLLSHVSMKESFSKLVHSKAITSREFDDSVELDAKKLKAIATGSTLQQDLFAVDDQLKKMRGEQDLALAKVGRANKDLDSLVSTLDNRNPLDKKALLENVYNISMNWADKHGVDLETGTSNHYSNDKEMDLADLMSSEMFSEFAKGADTSKVTSEETKFARFLAKKFKEVHFDSMQDFIDAANKDYTGALDQYLSTKSVEKAFEIKENMDQSSLNEELGKIHSKTVLPFNIDGVKMTFTKAKDTIRASLASGMPGVAFTHRDVELYAIKDELSSAGSQRLSFRVTYTTPDTLNLPNYNPDFFGFMDVSHRTNPVKLANQIGALVNEHKVLEQRIAFQKNVIEKMHVPSDEDIKGLEVKRERLSKAASIEEKTLLESYKGPKGIEEWVQQNRDKCTFLPEKEVQSKAQDAFDKTILKSYVSIFNSKKNTLPIEPGKTSKEQREAIESLQERFERALNIAVKRQYHPDISNALSEKIADKDHLARIVHLFYDDLKLQSDTKAARKDSKKIHCNLDATKPESDWITRGDKKPKDFKNDNDDSPTLNSM